MNHNSIEDVVLILFLILIFPLIIAGFFKGPPDESKRPDEGDKHR